MAFDNKEPQKEKINMPTKTNLVKNRLRQGLIRKAVREFGGSLARKKRIRLQQQMARFDASVQELNEQIKYFNEKLGPALTKWHDNPLYGSQDYKRLRARIGLLREQIKKRQAELDMTIKERSRFVAKNRQVLQTLKLVS